MTGSFYFHYWYADYYAKTGREPEIHDIHTSVKNNIKTLKIEAKQRKKNAWNKDSDMTFQEFEGLISFLEGDQTNDIRKQIFDANTVKNEITPMQKVRAMTENTGLTNKELSQYPEKISSMIEEFTLALNDFLNEAYQKIGIQNIETYKSMVIQEYCNKQHVVRGSGNFNDRVLKDFLTHEGIVKLGLGIKGGSNEAQNQASLQTSLRSLTLLAEALPSYDGKSLGARNYSTGNKGNKKTSSSIETLDVIAGKCNGLFNNIVGAGGELAAAIAEESLEEGLSAKLKQLNSEKYGPGITIISDVVGEDASAGKMAKGDNHVKIIMPDKNGGSGQVLIDYGLSVKNYKINAKSNTATINLTNTTSFWNAMLKYAENNNGGADFGYLYHLAASYAGRGGGKEGQHWTIENTYLTQAWNTVVQDVVVTNFLDILAGVIGEQQTALYLNFNGRVKSLDEILSDLVANPNMLASRINNGETNRKLTRTALMRLNQFKYIDESVRNRYKQTDKELGYERSREAYENIRSALQGAKLSVSLNYDLRKLGVL